MDIKKNFELAKEQNYLQQPQEFARPKSITRRRVKSQLVIDDMSRILLYAKKYASRK
jgi:hypothetical protein